MKGKLPVGYIGQTLLRALCVLDMKLGIIKC